MFRKILLLGPTALIGALLTATVQSAAMAPPGGEHTGWHDSPEHACLRLAVVHLPPRCCS